MEWTDAAIQAWQRNHPDLDWTALLPLLRLDTLARLFDPFLRDVLEPLEIGPSEYRVLAALAPGGEPEREMPTRLARRLGHTTGGMTKILRRLETQGLVARHGDPDDGRGLRIELTPRGEATLTRALRALALAAGRRLASIPASTRAEIALALDRFAAALAADPSAGSETRDSPTGGGKGSDGGPDA